MKTFEENMEEVEELSRKLVELGDHDAYLDEMELTIRNGIAPLMAAHIFRLHADLNNLTLKELANACTQVFHKGLQVGYLTRIYQEKEGIVK